MGKKKKAGYEEEIHIQLNGGSDSQDFLNAISGDLFIKSFEVLPQPSLLTDKNFTILISNPSVCRLLQTDHKSFSGKSIFDIFIFREDFDKHSLKLLIKQGLNKNSIFVQSNLSDQHFNFIVLPVEIKTGNFFLIQLTEISKITIASTSSRSADLPSYVEEFSFKKGFQSDTAGNFENAFLRKIIDSLPHPFYILEAVSQQPLVRNIAARQFEESISSVHCKMKDRPVSCSGNAYNCAMNLVINSTTPARIEHEFITKSGEKRIHEIFGYPVFNKDDKLWFVIQYSIDITDRKRNEVEILEYQAILDNLMSNLPGMAFRCLNESNWTMEYASPGSRKLTGFTANELINNKKTHYGDLILNEDRTRVWNEVQKAVARHRLYRIEYRIVTKNGKVKWVLEQGKGVFDKYDKLVRLEGLITDINSSKHAELQLKKELAINQGIATIGVELLSEAIKPARVAYLVQQYSRMFTGSEFSLVISPASEDETSYLFCFDENDENDENARSKRVRRHFPKPGEPAGLIDQLLTEQKPVIVNKPGLKVKIPCVSPGEFTFSRLLSVPAFINNKYAGIIILANASYDYTDEMVAIVQRFINMYALAAYRLKAEETLQKAKERAEASDHLKSLFLSNMSHEIRTPMNAILGFAEMLQDVELSIDEKDRFLDVIIKSGDNLLRLINDIIDISKIEAGQLKVIYSDCYINELFSDLEVFFNRELARLRKDHLTLYIQPGNSDPDFVVYTDPVRIRQIISNLIGNALKFTDEGFIELGYSIKNKNIEFYVRDSGVGIPADQQKVIFERFGQVKDDAARNLSGTGLGLTISKNLVELLGGRIWLDSYPGEGSTFWFSIPFIIGHHRKQSEDLPDSSVLPETDLRGKTILVVEDVETNFFYISSLLGKVNGKVLRAEDGEKAVELCRTNPEINLVLMDIELPVLDGYSATRQIKKIRPDLPVIAQTAFAMMGERERSAQAGCDDYIAKPIRKEILFDVVSKHI